MTASPPHPYAELTPALILDAVEQAGYRCSGHLLALNSYENRVFQIGLEDAPPLVVKFYRPARWSDAAILEEHAFALELAAHEIPVVAPLVDAQGETLLRHAGFRFALYPRHGGHAPPWMIRRTWKRWAASSGASMPSAACAASGSAANWTSASSAGSRAATCLPPAICPPT